MNTWYAGGYECRNGHVIVWAGDPNYKIPEGFPCACGQTVAHYEYCPTCQQTRMVMIQKKREAIKASMKEAGDESV